MMEFKYTVKDKNGLHARPAGMMCSLLKTFNSDVTVKTREKEADGKRLLSLMSLGAKCGTELHFIINGSDEDEAARALKSYCEEKLGEE